MTATFYSQTTSFYNQTNSPLLLLRMNELSYPEKLKGPQSKVKVHTILSQLCDIRGRVSCFDGIFSFS